MILDLAPAQATRLARGASALWVTEPRVPSDATEAFVWSRGNLPKENCAEEGLYAQRICRPVRDSWLRYLGPVPYRPGDVLALREEWAAAEWFDDTPSHEIPEYDPDAPIQPSRQRVGYFHGGCITDLHHYHGRKRPANELPDWAIRHRLTVLSCELRRAAEVSEEEAMKLGVVGADSLNLLTYAETLLAEVGDVWGWLVKLERMRR